MPTRLLQREHGHEGRKVEGHGAQVQRRRLRKSDGSVLKGMGQQDRSRGTFPELPRVWNMRPTWF